MIKFSPLSMDPIQRVIHGFKNGNTQWENCHYIQTNLWDSEFDGLTNLRQLDVFPGGLASKGSACNEGDLCSTPGLGRFPWRKWQSAPASLPAQSQGLRSLLGYSPGGHRVRRWVPSTHTNLNLYVECLIPKVVMEEVVGRIIPLSHIVS